MVHSETVVFLLWGGPHSGQIWIPMHGETMGDPEKRLHTVDESTGQIYEAVYVNTFTTFNMNVGGETMTMQLFRHSENR